MTGRPPDTLRLWSLVYREDRAAAVSHASAPNLGSYVHLQNKADPSEFDAILRDPPTTTWICSIADGGKIHVVPHARINHGADTWCVRYERFNVHSNTAEYIKLAGAMQALLDVGFSKGDIKTEPSPGRLVRCGIDMWRTYDSLLRRYRGGALFEVALFLRRRKDGNTDRDGKGDAARAGDDA